MNQRNRDTNLLIFILFFIALAVSFFHLNDFKLREKQKTIEKERIAKIQKIHEAFSSVPILAKAVSVYNVDLKEELYGMNQNVVLPLASLSKIMTAITALETYNLEDVITISQISTERNQNNSISLGEKWTVEDLIKFTLISSSNDGALALSRNEKSFLFKMNILSRKIGFIGTEFFNFTGLDESDNESGAYGSARDMNMLAIYATEKYPSVFNSTILSKMSFQPKVGVVHEVINTNTITEKIPNIIFSKTGYTKLAGGNLTVIFKNKLGERIAITLLGSTREGRFSDMEKLVEIAYNLDYGRN